MPIMLLLILLKKEAKSFTEVDVSMRQASVDCGRQKRNAEDCQSRFVDQNGVAMVVDQVDGSYNDKNWQLLLLILHRCSIG